MKSEDSLFKEIYQEIIFIGSFYKGTKIEKPNEFDLNIILKLPFNNKQINVRIFLFLMIQKFFFYPVLFRKTSFCPNPNRSIDYV